MSVQRVEREQYMNDIIYNEGYVSSGYDVFYMSSTPIVHSSVSHFTRLLLSRLNQGISRSIRPNLVRSAPSLHDVSGCHKAP
jgi:hypothetical protein